MLRVFFENVSRGIGQFLPFLSLTCFSFLTLFVAVSSAQEGNSEPANRGEVVRFVNIYSYRQPTLIQPVLDAFTQETGIATRVIYAEEGLLERLQIEGRNAPADLVLTTDISVLALAKTLGVTQPVVDAPALQAIPETYKDPEGHWFGLTTRARVVFASKKAVEETALTYEDLADPRWKGRLCTRSGQHLYTIGLVSAFLAHHGEEATKKWLIGVRDNLARKPSGNDRAQVKSIFLGECVLALGNTYYMGKMLLNEKEPEQKEWAASVHIIFPRFEKGGTHVNISGMFMARYASHRVEARALMEFLASQKAQALYAQLNHEYPVLKEVPVSDLVASWGHFKADPLPLSEIAKNQKRASELVDMTQFDEGPAQ